jgi:hypothetical protein
MTARAIKTVRSVCWDAHAKAASSLLREAGFRVVDDSLKGVGGIIGHFLRVAPDAVAIDLDRLPSQGRELAMLLRKSKTMRHLPIVFCRCTSEKVARLHAHGKERVATQARHYCQDTRSHCRGR